MTIARVLVWAIVFAEVALPVALVFWAGRRFERRQIGRRFGRQVVGVAAHDADAGETVAIELGGRRLGVVPDPPAIPVGLLERARGFRARRR